MGYVAKRDIKVFSIGKQWRAGARIGDEQIPRKLREQMLAEGVIESVGGAVVVELDAEGSFEIEGGSVQSVSFPATDAPALLDVPGMSEERVVALAEMGITTVAALAIASPGLLAESMHGVGPVTAESLINRAQDVLDEEAHLLSAELPEADDDDQA